MEFLLEVSIFKPYLYYLSVNLGLKEIHLTYENDRDWFKGLLSIYQVELGPEGSPKLINRNVDMGPKVSLLALRRRE